MFYNLLSQIIIAVVKCKTGASSDSLDSLDSYEKPPLLNRHLYQPPRRATFSKCNPESEVSCKENTFYNLSSLSWYNDVHKCVCRILNSWCLQIPSDILVNQTFLRL